MERVPKPKPAYVDDMDDETGRTVRGTRRSAAVPREKPKVSQRERDAQKEGRTGKRRTSRLDQSYPTEDDIYQQQAQQQNQLIAKEDARLERRKSNTGNTKSPRKSDRHPTAHESRNYPQMPHISTSHQQRENHTHYGMPAPPRPGPPLISQQQPIPIRPRVQSTQTVPNNRPSSFVQQNGGPGYGPPPAMSAFYQPPTMAAPSYPPPSPSSSYLRFIQTPTGGGGDYFSPHAVSRPLSSRFDPIARTQSAYGSHPPPASSYDPVPRTTSAFGQHESQSRALVDYNEGGYYDDGYTSASDGTSLRRREPRDSIRVPSQAFSKAELDYRAMPPPTRPSVHRRPATEYRAPSEYTIDPVDTRQDRQDRRQSREYYEEPVRPRRPSTHRHSVSYDLAGPERITVEAANSSRRRQTSYEQPASSVDDGSSTYEDKIHKATSYQEDVGGPTVPLTADMLKKQQRREAGSRSSTKSSASRDESDYKKSATTRTTRSGSGNGNEDENVTIKVTGQARVMVGNTAIDCTEGGEIEIRQNKNFRDDRTQRSNSEFGGGTRFEERRSRADRPAIGRTRMSSQSGQSYARPTPQSHYAMDNDYF